MDKEWLWRDQKIKEQEKTYKRQAEAAKRCAMRSHIHDRSSLSVYTWQELDFSFLFSLSHARITFFFFVTYLYEIRA